MPAYDFPCTPDDPDKLQAIPSEGTVRYDGDNQISNLSSVHYDLAGNPAAYPAGSSAATLTFDAENRMTSWSEQSGTAVSFGYNGDGLRAWKQVGTSTSARIYYLYDGSQPVAELNYNGTVLNATNAFGANGLLSRNAGGASTFYTFGPQGEVCQRFGSSANLLSTDEYDAFGMLQATTQTGAGDVFGFGAQSGYQTDQETGLLLLTNRYYDPGLARFLTRDPLGQAGGANLYGYVGNNPTSFADPLGLFSQEDAFVAGFGILGGIGGAWACLGNPLCIAGGAALGAATARYELGHDVGAAVDTGAQAAALAGSLGCLSTFPPGGGQLSLPFEELEEDAAASGGSNTLYHYTNGPGRQGILATQQLDASVGGPKVAYYGSGQYLTNIAPGSGLSRYQISYRLYTTPWNFRKVSNWVAIDVTGLDVQQHTPYIFRVPGEDPLDLTGRIVGSGVTP
jgi:RHS repeat-associated protein